MKSSLELEIPFHYRDYKKRERSDLATADTILSNPQSKSENIFNFADLNKAAYPPLFKNSTMNLNTYIYENLSYPAQAFRSSISGKVVLDYVIEKKRPTF